MRMFGGEDAVIDVDDSPNLKVVFGCFLITDDL